MEFCEVGQIQKFLFADAPVCGGRTYSTQPSAHRQKLYLELLYRNPDVQMLYATETDRMRLRKRLQRSRKYSTLVDIFGQWILDVVPQVCVSRLDVIRSEDLEAIRRDPLEADRIKRIRACIAASTD